MKNNKRIAKIICSLCLWSLVLLCIVPFIWMVSASFKREADIFAVPFRLIPDYLNLQNFKEVWFGKYSYSLMFLNSAKVTLLSVGFAVTTSILAGYGFSKIKFPGRDKIFLLYLATMMIPHQLLMVPKMLMFKEMGIYNTHWALILPAAFSIYGVISILIIGYVYFNITEFRFQCTACLWCASTCCRYRRNFLKQLALTGLEICASVSRL